MPEPKLMIGEVMGARQICWRPQSRAHRGGLWMPGQIAEALEAAQEKGIIYRDLNPSK